VIQLLRNHLKENMEVRTMPIAQTSIIPSQPLQQGFCSFQKYVKNKLMIFLVPLSGTFGNVREGDGNVREGEK